MDNLVEENHQEQSANVSDLSQRLVYINEKLIKISEENDKAKSVISQQDSQLKDLQTRFEKLSTVGERYGVTLEKDKEEKT